MSKRPWPVDEESSLQTPFELGEYGHDCIASLLEVAFCTIDSHSVVQLGLDQGVKSEGQTGVEMEAMTAVSVGLLTLYDMLKAVDPAMVLGDIRLLKKEGGRHGFWSR